MVTSTGADCDAKSQGQPAAAAHVRDRRRAFEGKLVTYSLSPVTTTVEILTECWVASVQLEQRALLSRSPARLLVANYVEQLAGALNELRPSVNTPT